MLVSTFKNPSSNCHQKKSWKIAISYCICSDYCWGFAAQTAENLRRKWKSRGLAVKSTLDNLTPSELLQNNGKQFSSDQLWDSLIRINIEIWTLNNKSSHNKFLGKEKEQKRKNEDVVINRIAKSQNEEELDQWGWTKVEGEEHLCRQSRERNTKRESKSSARNIKRRGTVGG